MLQKTSVFR